MKKNDIYVRGWGAVTSLGWSAPESAQNLIAGKVTPAKAGSSSHLISREYKAFEVSCSGNPLEKTQAMLDSAITEAISRAGLSPAEIAESALLVGTTYVDYEQNQASRDPTDRPHGEQLRYDSDRAPESHVVERQSSRRRSRRAT